MDFVVLAWVQGLIYINTLVTSTSADAPSVPCSSTALSLPRTQHQPGHNFNLPPHTQSSCLHDVLNLSNPDKGRGTQSSEDDWTH